jgi:opacity protein-like surface antigen
MRKYLVALCFIALGGTAAQADRPFNWTGFYMGLHGGWASTDIESDVSGKPVQGLEGGIVGAQVGAQYQFQGGLVTGVEADISFAKLTQTVRDGNYITQSGTISQLGSVRGRLGYAMGAWMPYLTGGFAWDRLEQTQQCPDPAAVPFGHCNVANGFAPYNLGKTITNTGWVYGLGIEHAINKVWSFRLEGLRYEFGSETYALGTTPSGKTLTPYALKHDVDVVRFATNMKF